MTTRQAEQQKKLRIAAPAMARLLKAAITAGYDPDVPMTPEEDAAVQYVLNEYKQEKSDHDETE